MCPELDNCREKTKIISYKEDQLMDTRVPEGIWPKSLTPITFFKDFIKASHSIHWEKMSEILPAYGLPKKPSKSYTKIQARRSK